MKRKESNENKIKREAIKFLEERASMVREGFPYCYEENFVQFHCNSCMHFYRERKKTHNSEMDVNILV